MDWICLAESPLSILGSAFNQPFIGTGSPVVVAQQCPPGTFHHPRQPQGLLNLPAWEVWSRILQPNGENETSQGPLLAPTLRFGTQPQMRSWSRQLRCRPAEDVFIGNPFHGLPAHLMFQPSGSISCLLFFRHLHSSWVLSNYFTNLTHRPCYCQRQPLNLHPESCFVTLASGCTNLHHFYRSFS